MVNNSFHITRANDNQNQIVADVFGGKALDRYTECLFHPDLHLVFTGRSNSLVGKLDAFLGDFAWLGRWLARQRSFETRKI